MKYEVSMLNYCKQILQIVCFDKKLFKKEYRKSMLWLSPLEVTELKLWIRNTILLKLN